MKMDVISHLDPMFRLGQASIFQKGQSLAYYALGIAFQLKNAQRPTLIRQVYSFPFEKREMSGEVFKAWCHISVKFVPMVREGRKRINLSGIQPTLS